MAAWPTKPRKKITKPSFGNPADGAYDFHHIEKQLRAAQILK
jgi:hypothetical protein